MPQPRIPLVGYVRVSSVASRRDDCFQSPALQREVMERWATLRYGRAATRQRGDETALRIVSCLIGRGGIATVWRARDTRLRRDVAVKVIPTPTGFASSEYRAHHRAMREARAAARITHPAAVAVFDVVDAGESVFIVMELVRAPSLDTVVREQGVLSPAAAAAVGERLCAALGAAHEVG